MVVASSVNGCALKHNVDELMNVFYVLFTNKLENKTFFQKEQAGQLWRIIKKIMKYFPFIICVQIAYFWHKT